MEKGLQLSTDSKWRNQQIMLLFWFLWKRGEKPDYFLLKFFLLIFIADFFFPGFGQTASQVFAENKGS